MLILAMRKSALRRSYHRAIFWWRAALAQCRSISCHFFIGRDDGISMPVMTFSHSLFICPDGGQNIIISAERSKCACRASIDTITSNYFIAPPHAAFSAITRQAERFNNTTKCEAGRLQAR